MASFYKTSSLYKLPIITKLCFLKPILDFSIFNFFPLFNFFNSLIDLGNDTRRVVFNGPLKNLDVTPLRNNAFYYGKTINHKLKIKNSNSSFFPHKNPPLWLANVQYPAIWMFKKKVSTRRTGFPLTAKLFKSFKTIDKVSWKTWAFPARYQGYQKRRKMH